MDSSSEVIGCNLGYFRSIAGILKIIELLCDFLATILAGAPSVPEGASGKRGFFLFVSIVGLILTFILLVLALLNIFNVVRRVPWPLIELGWCGFMTLFYFIASIVIATAAKDQGAYGGATFFGFAAMITYAADAFFQFRTYRGGSSNSAAQQYAANSRAPQYAPNPADHQRPQPTY